MDTEGCISFEYDYGTEDAGDVDRCTTYSEEGMAGNGDDGSICWKLSNDATPIELSNYSLTLGQCDSAENLQDWSENSFDKNVVGHENGYESSNNW